MGPADVFPGQRIHQAHVTPQTLMEQGAAALQTMGVNKSTRLWLCEQLAETASVKNPSAQNTVNLVGINNSATNADALLKFRAKGAGTNGLQQRFSPC